MRLLLIIATALMLSMTAFAEEHPMSTITGQHIDLKSFDHAFAGSIHGFLVWGEVNEQEFKSELIMRRDGQTVRAVFQKNEDGTIGGAINHEVNGLARSTDLRFKKIDKENTTLLLERNGSPVTVAIKADKFENNHFENPTYTVTYEGQTFSYTLNGHACYAYSLHMAFLMVGAYTH